MSKPSLIRRFFSALWCGITWVRVALSNLLFLAVILVLYFVLADSAPEPLPEHAALLLNITGTVVDERSQVDPMQALLGEPSPENHEVPLRDIIDAIEFATQDPAINSIVLELDQLVYVGISKTQEIVRALEAFKASGKPVVAVGDYYSQDQYLLASHADNVILHPIGGVAVEGYSSYHNYYRDALEKLSVKVHVFRAGEHKSIAEPFLRNDMSPNQKEISLRWLSIIWEQYTQTVEAQRELASGTVDNYANNFASLLLSRGGSTAELALEMGLVDQLLPRTEANEYLVDMVGAADDEGLYEAVFFEHYVERQRPLPFSTPTAERVAVITAQGNIVPGEQGPGAIGGDSLARLISSTAAEEGVKAIVLRISSGGGSVFASEVIRQQVLNARASGVPVVVSMGAVAASGGYYIAAEADEIFATPSTITGSIGVFAAFPTFENLLQRAGVSTDGVGTTQMAGSLRVDRPLNPQLAQALESSIVHTYDSFLKIVADGRDMSMEEADALGQGRVWSAVDALENGLVDSLGDLDDAIAAAAARAELEDYEVEFVQLPLSPRDLFLQQLADRTGSLGLWTHSGAAAVLSELLRPVVEAAAEISSLSDPGHLYMRCVACGVFR